MGHKGGICLGMGGDNSNNSMGTFYEGAMVAGYPTNDIEAKVMANIKEVGYAPAAH
jgi:non-reducing end alpha-L-arabinofuranosidase